MDVHNIVAFGIIVAVHIWFAHGDLSPQKRHTQEFIENCEDRWALFNRRCYIYMVAAETWETARVVCNGACGALVNITSADENEFLNDLKSSETTWPSVAWIGLNAVDDPNILDQSGNTTRYTNWANGQPDNHKDLENCVEMNVGGKWNVISCTQYKSYFCEKSPFLRHAGKNIESSRIKNHLIATHIAMLLLIWMNVLTPMNAL